MAGTTASLNNEPHTIDAGFDSVTIMKMLEDIPGGKTLDVTGFLGTIIRAGHLVIKDAGNIYKPMPINVLQNAYEALPSNHTYIGVVIASVVTTKPFVAIMVRGAMNEQAFINGGGFATPAAAKTALNLIRFTKD